MLHNTRGLVYCYYYYSDAGYTRISASGILGFHRGRVMPTPHTQYMYLTPIDIRREYDVQCTVYDVHSTRRTL